MASLHSLSVNQMVVLSSRSQREVDGTADRGAQIYTPLRTYVRSINALSAKNWTSTKTSSKQEIWKWVTLMKATIAKSNNLHVHILNGNRQKRRCRARIKRRKQTIRLTKVLSIICDQGLSSATIRRISCSNQKGWTQCTGSESLGQQYGKRNGN
jgi:hypothetical protein